MARDRHLRTGAALLLVLLLTGCAGGPAIPDTT